MSDQAFSIRERGGMSSALQYPPLLRDRSEVDRQHWPRCVLGSHSDSFLPMMVAAVQLMDRHDPIVNGFPVLASATQSDDLVVIACERGRHCVVVDQPLPSRVILFDCTGESGAASSTPMVSTLEFKAEAITF